MKSTNISVLSIKPWCMLVVICMQAFLCWPTEATAQYYTGPRGGCYTLTKSGNKRYVDRSMCLGQTGSMKAEQKIEEDQSKVRSSVPQSRYHVGPRGGCYTISANGNKRYVDRSLCTSSSN